MVIISNDDPTFLWWRANNPGGYILVTTNPPSETYLSLHRVGGCHLVNAAHPANGDSWTVSNAKVCSSSRVEIEEWAQRNFNREVIECGLCYKHK